MKTDGLMVIAAALTVGDVGADRLRRAKPNAKTAGQHRGEDAEIARPSAR